MKFHSKLRRSDPGIKSIIPDFWKRGEIAPAINIGNGRYPCRRRFPFLPYLGLDTNLLYFAFLSGCLVLTLLDFYPGNEDWRAGASNRFGSLPNHIY